jgi:lactoylglutathione lyase
VSTTASGTQTEKTSGGINALSPQIAYVSYRVANIERALSFYVGVLGMKEQLRMALGGGVHEVVLSFPEQKGMGLILMWNEQRKEAYSVGDGYSRLVLRVSDLAAAMTHLAKHDTKIVKEIQQTPVLDYAIVQDGDGYMIELLQMKRR